MRNLLKVVLILGVVACQKDKEPQVDPKAPGPGGQVNVPAGGAKPIAPGKIGMSPAHQSVVRRLNEDGMLRIPEVSAKSAELMGQVGKNGATIESQAIIFDKWLTQFAANNAEKVRAAKREAEAARSAQPGAPGAQGGPPKPIVLPPPQPTAKQ